MIHSFCSFFYVFPNVYCWAMEIFAFIVCLIIPFRNHHRWILKKDTKYQNDRVLKCPWSSICQHWCSFIEACCFHQFITFQVLCILRHLSLLCTLKQTQREKGSVMRTNNMENDVSNQPQTPIPLSSSS